MPRQRTITRPQTAALLDKLRQHCKTNGEGYAVYEDGWDDIRIQRECPNPNPEQPYSIASVSKWRFDLFGRLRGTTKAKSNADEIAELKQRVKELEARDDEVRASFNALLGFLQRKIGYVPPQGRPMSKPPETQLQLPS